MSVDYLRISVTDRCNLRCLYCDPYQRRRFISRDDVLRFEEIHRIARLFAQCGVTSIRLTGGEPLMRKDLPVLVRKLGTTPGIKELSLTTNGVLLEPVAHELKAAGLRRVNISVDSLNRDIYREITGFDVLEEVRRGIHAAIEIGLTPVKINAVILNRINDSQIAALAQLSLDLPVMVRFIEYCPANSPASGGLDYVPNSKVRDIIERRFGALCNCLAAEGNGPAYYLKIPGSAGAVGFISGRTTVFCQSCNRLRLTSDGKVKPCLYSSRYYDLKSLVRGHITDPQLLEVLKGIIEQKNRYTKLNSLAERFSMREVGG